MKIKKGLYFKHLIEVSLKMHKTFAVFVLVLLSQKLIWAGESAVDKLFNQAFSGTKLKVVYLYDSRFPDMDLEVLAKSLIETERVMSDKFNFKNIRFEKGIQKIELEKFFNKLLSEKERQTPHIEHFKNKNHDAFKITSSLKSFYSNFDLPDLNKFLVKEGKPKVNRVEDFHRELVEKWFEKFAKFLKVKYKGQPVFDINKAYLQCYSIWFKALAKQDEFDYVFTNTLIFYDEIREPYPHSIFKHAKIGGTPFYNLNLKSKLGGGAMTSTIAFSDIPYFGEANIDKKSIHQVMGIYLNAHELAHGLFNLLDYYDHPKHCLMNTPPEELNYKIINDIYLDNPKPCDLCRPLVSYWKYRILKRQKGADAKKIMKIALKDFDELVEKFPKISDAHYYRSFILVDMQKMKDAYLGLKAGLMVSEGKFNYLSTLAYITLNIKKYVEASEYFEKLILQNPYDQTLKDAMKYCKQQMR